MFRNEGPNIDGIIRTSLQEITEIIKSTKSPGLDNVSNILLKNRPLKVLGLLVIIFNRCIELNYFPTQFKIAKVIPIPKVNKPKHDPKSYRPISLLSNVGKLFERIIYKRLNDFASENELTTNEQFGFKKEHSAVHQVARIKNIISTKYRKYRKGF